MNIIRILMFLLGLFILGVSLLNLFFIPINTVLSCDGTEGNCTAHQQYFFYTKDFKRFKIPDITSKSLVTHGGTAGMLEYRDWSLNLKTPVSSLVLGKYSSKKAAQQELQDLEDFQQHPIGKVFYINAHSHLEHIITTIGGLIIAVFFIWNFYSPLQVKPRERI